MHAGNLILIRSAAGGDALTGSGKTVVPEEHQNSSLCLHVNKPLNHLIAPQPPCQKTLCLILLIKEPFGRMRIRYGSKGTRLSLCNCLVGAGRSHCQRTVSYTHLRAHETRHDLVCRLLLEKKK